MNEQRVIHFPECRAARVVRKKNIKIYSKSDVN